jgi:uncharacterized integral membrane protein
MYMKETSTKEKFTPTEEVKQVMYVLVAALLLEILILIFAIRAIFMCQNAGKWNVLVSILLILALFVPYVGLPLAVLLMIYANVACKSGLTAPLRLRK